jgi:hypothetical protein
MKQILVTTYYSILIVIIALSASLAQETKKQEKDAKETVLGRLHPSLVESPPPMNIELLAGYAHKAATDFEGNKVGYIWKESGVKIRYEIGMSQGHAVDLDLKNTYQWFREQIMQGRKVKLALDRENTLLITIPLDKKSSWHAANFYGEIRKPEDIVDMMLMILTFRWPAAR